MMNNLTKFAAGLTMITLPTNLRLMFSVPHGPMLAKAQSLTMSTSATTKTTLPKRSTPSLRMMAILCGITVKTLDTTRTLTTHHGARITKITASLLMKHQVRCTLTHKLSVKDHSLPAPSRAPTLWTFAKSTLMTFVNRTLTSVTMMTSSTTIFARLSQTCATLQVTNTTHAL